jgi:UDP-glucose 4-epimerase
MKYVITGGSGYIGGRLIDMLTQREDSEVVNIDLRPPAVPRPRTRFVRMDIRDRGMRSFLESERPDALVHQAFLLNPIRD